MACLGLCAALSAGAPAHSQGTTPGFVGIDREVQAIKGEILEINRELSRLEEALLYPAEQQLTVFLSVPADTRMSVGALQVTLDGEPLVRHLYSEAEVTALRKGGVQKSFVGKLAPGDHLLQAQISGTDAGGKAFQLNGSVRFAKERGPKYVELRVGESGLRRTPELSVDYW